MLAIKIWNYLRGYVIIKINGLSLERLLNLALNHEVYLWDVKRIDNTKIEATVSLVGYEELEKIVSKMGCRLEILHSSGLPVMWKKLQKRKMLGFGAVIFICIIAFLSSIIWEIDIIGAEQIPVDEIFSVLEANDIKKGTLKNKVQEEDIKKILLNEFEYISFLDIKIHGVKLTVELRELDIPIEKVDKSYPCHIVAKKKGVIVKIVARNGNAIVRKGEIVDEGTVLISGIIQGELDDNSYSVHAEGDVLARTRYTAIVEEEIVSIERVETGNVYKQTGLKFKDKGIKFLSGDIPYEDYIEEVTERDVLDFSWAKSMFPLKIVKYTFREVETEEIKREMDFLKKTAQLKAIKLINEQLPEDAEIISKDAIYTLGDNILKVQIIIETIEDISKIQIISN